MKKILLTLLAISFTAIFGITYANSQNPLTQTVVVSNTGTMTVHKWEYDNELSNLPNMVLTEQSQSTQVIWPTSAHVYQVDYRAERSYFPVENKYYNDGCRFKFYFDDNGTCTNATATPLDARTLCSVHTNLLNYGKLIFDLNIKVMDKPVIS